jgi:hypothetical protein
MRVRYTFQELKVGSIWPPGYVPKIIVGEGEVAGVVRDKEDLGYGDFFVVWDGRRREWMHVPVRDARPIEEGE